jgi:hypothetical protein
MGLAPGAAPTPAQLVMVDPLNLASAVLMCHRIIMAMVGLRAQVAPEP